MEEKSQRVFILFFLFSTRAWLGGRRAVLGQKYVTAKQMFWINAEGPQISDKTTTQTHAAVDEKEARKLALYFFK